MPLIEAWTDGSGCTRTRTGGWAAVIKLPGSPFVQEIYGAVEDTTSQRMEMTALLRVLEHFEERRDLIVHSDSAYVINCFEQNWIAGWRKRNWMTSKGTPVANRDLWENLETQMRRHKVHFIKVRGHAGHEYNERADVLAGQARKTLLTRIA